MTRTDTRRAPTQVVEIKAVRDRSTEQLVDQSMNGLRSTVPAQNAIALRLAASPVPTTVAHEHPVGQAIK